MDQGDRELLDKQLRGLYRPSRNDGVLVLAVLAMFFVGMTLGGFLAAYKSEPTHIAIASNDATPAIQLSNISPLTTRR